MAIQIYIWIHNEPIYRICILICLCKNVAQLRICVNMCICKPTCMYSDLLVCLQKHNHSHVVTLLCCDTIVLEWLNNKLRTIIRLSIKLIIRRFGKRRQAEAGYSRVTAHEQKGTNSGKKQRGHCSHIHQRPAGLVQ